MLTLLDHPLITERYFFPRKSSPLEPFWVECNGVRLACAYEKIIAGGPTLVHYHGNGEIVNDYVFGFSDKIVNSGANCFLAEYRGYGGSSGEPQLGQMFADVVPLIKAIKCKENKIILFGRSVGSLFAIKAAMHFPNVAGMVLESAIADPLERLLIRVAPHEIGATSAAIEKAVSEAIDIQNIMMNFNKPTMILHTRNDGLIDVSHAERLSTWCQGPVTFHVFPKGNHNDIMFENESEYFTLIKNFIASLRA